MSRKLSIDIETYSSANLKDTGVYKYAEAEDFTILLLAYAFDNGPVQVVDLAGGQELPLEVEDAILYTDVELHAWNAVFERICINRHFGWDIPVERWHCTMVHAAMAGMPLSLEQAARVLRLGEESQKDAKGKALIRFFCGPCKATKSNGQRTRNLPEHDGEKWNDFIEYCRQDVVTERAIRDAIAYYQIPARERDLYILDQTINDLGVQLDLPMIRNALRIDAAYRERLEQEAIQLTGLSNPNSVSQLREWLEQETDTEIPTLRKDDVKALLGTVQEGDAQRVLEIRQEMSKTSVKKYNAMLKTICADGRCRGLFQFYGANRTGRWAGRLVQVQNLPKNEIKGPDLDLARSIVSEGDGLMLELLYGSVPSTLSQLIRTAFVAPSGSRLIVCDAAAIEARILAWLANEKWRLDVFRTHGKVYEASASQMFKIPIEFWKDEITGEFLKSDRMSAEQSSIRQKGKVSELALGYGGGPRALEAMGALKMGIEESELQGLVTTWRNANPAIITFWRALESAAITAIRTGVKQTVKPGITFSTSNRCMFIELPSGRKLSYVRPKLKPGKFGDAVAYEGLNQTTKQWMGEDTYGGKLAENITQAVARDCLAEAMLRVHRAGYRIGMHVHDEIVMQMPDGQGSLDEVERLMSEPIPWAPGLPLGADGFESKYYKK